MCFLWGSLATQTRLKLLNLMSVQSRRVAALVNADQRTSNAYRSVRPQYFMAWAYDPFFGCDIEYQQTSFKAVCVNNYYDLAGKILNGDVSARDLIVPDYQFVGADRISITINN